MPHLLGSSSPCSPLFPLSQGLQALGPIYPCSLGPAFPSQAGEMSDPDVSRVTPSRSEHCKQTLAPHAGDGTPWVQDVGGDQSSQRHRGVEGELFSPTYHSSPFSSIGGKGLCCLLPPLHGFLCAGFLGSTINSFNSSQCLVLVFFLQWSLHPFSLHPLGCPWVRLPLARNLVESLSSAGPCQKVSYCLSSPQPYEVGVLSPFY